MTYSTIPQPISVVVIGRNEGASLTACLESIRSARNIHLQQLLYIDSASTDGSPEAARALGATVTVVHPELPTAAIGRNAGWRQATAEFVLFLDGDTLLDPDFASIASAHLQADPTLAAVWGHRRELRPEASIYNRVLDLDWIYPPGIAEFFGGDVLIRLSVLKATEGFNETLIAGEEPELCRRIRALGYRILHIDHPMTGHDLKIYRLRQYWLRATRAGHAYAEVSARYANTSDPFWQQESRANLRRGAFWLLSPIAALALAAFWTPWVIVLWLAVVAAITFRTAWGARWKGGSLFTLLAYASHSHLQQIPIFQGQLANKWNRHRRKTRRLIEYKETT